MKAAGKARLALLAILLFPLPVAFFHATAAALELNFDSDPAADGVMIMTGSAQWTPGTDAFLSLTEDELFQEGAVVMKELDSEAVASFTFECDLRIGGHSETPADGLSINFASRDDLFIQAVESGAESPFQYFSGTDGEGGLAEEGTMSGLAIGFDAWGSGPIENGTMQDVIGISVRWNGEILEQKPTVVQTFQPPRVLGWAPCRIALDANGKIELYWKNNLFPFLSSEIPAGARPNFPLHGRFVIAARTAASSEKHHIDNIKITTHPLNTPLGTRVVVKPVPWVEITFDEVTKAGQTSASRIASPPPAPPGFKFGDPPACWEISTTATYTGNTTICFDYDESSFSDESSLKLLHHVGGAYVEVPTTLDTAANRTCGTVTSLSPFAIVEAMPVPTLKIGGTDSGIELSWPAASADFGLETTGDITATTWTSVANTPVVVNGQLVVGLDLGDATRFFRLRQQ